MLAGESYQIILNECKSNTDAVMKEYESLWKERQAELYAVENGLMRFIRTQLDWNDHYRDIQSSAGEIIEYSSIDRNKKVDKDMGKTENKTEGEDKEK